MGAELIHAGKKRDITKVISTSHSYAIAPKNHISAATLLECLIWKEKGCLAIFLLARCNIKTWISSRINKLWHYRSTWSVKFIWIIFENSVSTSQKSHYLSIYKDQLVNAFRKIIIIVGKVWIVASLKRWHVLSSLL